MAMERTGSNLLGAPLYETLSRRKREVKKGLPQVGGNQKWGEEEWPAERIIEYYGPATWAQDGSWGYRTPVYLLNRLIRLQAVVEIVSNHTSDALELLAKQHSQMRAFVYQNRIALDYLLAEEGGVCGKFNDSECCIEINDYGETIRDLAAEIKKVAHVPVQKWNSILKASWWDQIFGTGDWWKKADEAVLCNVNNQNGNGGSVKTRESNYQGLQTCDYCQCGRADKWVDYAGKTITNADDDPQDYGLDEVKKKIYLSS
ncbi:hypothetical protein DUI87_09759 [Hirundo rustica rustica]|uniref:Uncharacterized protein n=1 Tax=Hirundo rustica rustica TaxID=333673 RepID=A0A3M0KG85_HIRRU|nr:hypothetical protein DUI87_09759 [Hirundo rustica rustica]